MSERLQGHRTKLNANKMTCDGRCSSRRKHLENQKIAISYLTRIVLYEKVDAPCDKLAMVVGQTSTVASIVNLVLRRQSPVYYTKRARCVQPFR